MRFRVAAFAVTSVRVASIVAPIRVILGAVAPFLIAAVAALSAATFRATTLASLTHAAFSRAITRAIAVSVALTIAVARIP
jgi:hypothetical protein